MAHYRQIAPERYTIANWRRHAEHRVAQSTGMARWYSDFATRVARVERARTFKRD